MRKYLALLFLFSHRFIHECHLIQKIGPFLKKKYTDNFTQATSVIVYSV